MTGGFIPGSMPIVRRQAPALRLLSRVIEVEIVPRLVLSRRAPPPVACQNVCVPAPVVADSVIELTGIVLAHDAAAVSTYVEALRARGSTIETLFLDLLAPVARRLGDMWTDDLCDFAEVTMGLTRLQHVLHDLGPAFHPAVEGRANGRRALLVPAPGDQHSFGLSMVTEFFRRAGWSVWSGTPASAGELVGIVRREWFAMVGFSLGNPNGLDALATGIRAVRRASCNPAIGVMVGGPIFIERPELVALVGADATAADGQQAAVQAESLLALLADPG